jgi:hypothetical protein
MVYSLMQQLVSNTARVLTSFIPFFHAARVASASMSKDGSQGIHVGSRSSLSNASFFM